MNLDEVRALITSYGDLSILSDFDGTITNVDTNDAIFEAFGNKECELISQLYTDGKITLKDDLIQHYAQIKQTESELVSFVRRNITIDPGFGTFYHNIARYNIHFLIVSGGFTNYIETVLGEQWSDLIDVEANHLDFSGRTINVRFADDELGCKGQFGPCGHCKSNHLLRLRLEGKTVVYIGDGLTDRCIAQASDYVFAKGALAEFCHQEGIEHSAFSGFSDLNALLFGN